jgi:hypothetical protein
MVPAWPPRWLGPSQAGDASDNAPKPGEGVLESVMRHEDDHTLLRLTMRFGAQEHTALLLWDGPPPVGDVESLLRANVGGEIRAIGELEL